MDRSPSAIETLIRRLQGKLGGRHVRGVVDGATGAIMSGAGFAVSRTGVGQYAVAWDLPYDEIPAVTVTPAEINPYAGNFVVTTAPLSTGVTIHIKSPGVTFVDSDFSLHAIG